MAKGAFAELALLSFTAPAHAHDAYLHLLCNRDLS
jgi:hypothetical protein